MFTGSHSPASTHPFLPTSLHLYPVPTSQHTGLPFIPRPHPTTPSCLGASAHAHPSVRSAIHTHTHTHVCTRMNAHAHKDVHAHAHIDTHTCIHTDIHVHARCTRMCTQRHTRIHRETHTCTHMHTRVPALHRASPSPQVTPDHFCNCIIICLINMDVFSSSPPGCDLLEVRDCSSFVLFHSQHIVQGPAHCRCSVDE